MENHSMLMDQKINIIKISILPKAIYTYRAIPIKIPVAFFKVVVQTILNLVWKKKRCWIAKKMLKKKTKLGASHCLISSFSTKLWSTNMWYILESSVCTMAFCGFRVECSVTIFDVHLFQGVIQSFCFFLSKLLLNDLLLWEGCCGVLLLMCYY